MGLAVRRVLRVAKPVALGVAATAGVLVMLAWLFIAIAPDL